MKTLENSFLALGQSGRAHGLHYALSLFGLFLIVTSLSLLNWIFGVNLSDIQNSQVLLAIQLSSFAYILILFLIVASIIHKRPFLSFISASKNFNFKTLLVTFGLFLTLNILVELVNFLIFNQVYTFQFDLSKFIQLIVIAVSLLAIQSAAEEIILRGYLLQALSSWKKIHPITALLLTSIIFSFMHFSNPEFEEYGITKMFFSYFVIALFLGSFAILGNGLEIPIGIHAANNFYAAVLVNYKGSALNTDSLFIQNTINVPLALIEYIFMLMLVSVFLYKFKWIEHPKTLLSS